MRRDDLCHSVRERLERLPPPYAAHYGVVPLPPPEDAIPLGTLIDVHNRALQAIARISTLAGELADPYVLSRLLARREAISSSSIEGTNSTLDELLSLEEDAPDKLRDATLQVRDYALILDRLVPRAAELGPDIFTLDLISDVHRQAMKSDSAYQDTPGDLRNRVVWIGGVRDIAYSTYNPPPPSAVAACLADTAAYMRLEGMQGMTQSLITRMAIAHAHFEAVHPFRDGNGRTGRLLMPLMMAADGQIPLYLSPYIEAHKPDYYEALKTAQQRLDWAALVGFLAEAINGTVDELMTTRTALATLAGRWRSRRRYREGSAALRALDLLTSYPVITAKRLAARLNISVPSALAAIDQLGDAKILQEKTGYRRNRVFVAHEVLSIVNRPFGASPISLAEDA